MLDYLLAFIRKISHPVVLPPGTFDLLLHAGRDRVPKHPKLAALTHEGVTEEQAELAFFRVADILFFSLCKTVILTAADKRLRWFLYVILYRS